MNGRDDAAETPPGSLVVNSLRLRYGTFTAVDGVSFQVKAGEHLAIIGPSGSGKTSLLRCLAGLVRPNHGLIQFAGVSWNRETDHSVRPPR